MSGFVARSRASSISTMFTGINPAENAGIRAWEAAASDQRLPLLLSLYGRNGCLLGEMYMTRLGGFGLG